jgi:hypothetical protein
MTLRPSFLWLTPACLALAALTCGAAHAADEPIATDRPDFVESSDVVGKGRFQLETSIAGDRSTVDGVKVRTRSTPTLLRLGVSEDIELRIETDGRLRATALGVSQSGWADTSVGLKWHVADGDEAKGTAGMAWLLHADLPSGSRAFRGQGVRPSLRFVAEWEFAGGYNLGVMPGVYRERNDSGSSYVGGILAVTLAKSFTEDFRGFVELSGQQLTSKRNGGNVITADTGVAYLITKDLQVDAAITVGLNKQSPDFTWTTGVSVRF